MNNSIYHLILHSNLFNFSIFLIILIVIAKRFNILEIIESMRAKAVAYIDKSEESKILSQKNLESARESYSHAQSEIDEINKNAKVSADAMKSKIVKDAEIKVENIQNNSNELLKIEQKNIESLLISKLGFRSVAEAENIIKNQLQSKPDLHKKFIEQSINDLEEAVL